MSRERLTTSVEDIAEVLGISRSLAYELVRRGQLPSLRLCRRLVVPVRAVEGCDRLRLVEKRGSVMSLEDPAYWLAYVPESTETGPPVITAVAPEVLPPERFNADTRSLLAAADAFHVHHPGQRVVFAAAVTRWLHDKGFEWNDLDVDFFEALCELDDHGPALAIEATQLSMAVVASAATQCTIHSADGRSEPLDAHVEPVRGALLQALERDWPEYIRLVTRTAASVATRPPEASL